MDENTRDKKTPLEITPTTKLNHYIEITEQSILLVYPNSFVQTKNWQTCINEMSG
jgi:hypothetical protein